jgi:hypothetical protein
VTIRVPAVPDAKVEGLLSLELGPKTLKPLDIPTASPQSLLELADEINGQSIGITAHVVPKQGATELILQTSDSNARKDLLVTSTLSLHPQEIPVQPEPVKVEPGPADFLIWVPKEIRAALKESKTHVWCRLDDGTPVDLTLNPVWELDGDQPPLMVISIDNDEAPRNPGESLDSCDVKKMGLDNPKTCHTQFLIVKSGNDKQLLLGAEALGLRDLATRHAKDQGASKQAKDQGASQQAESSPTTGEPQDFLPDQERAGYLYVLPTLFDDPNSFYFLNGARLRGGPNYRPYPGTPEGWMIDWYRQKQGCRMYSGNKADHASASIRPPSRYPRFQKSNGVTVGAAKIFDVALLRKMLNDTANQLAAISGFSAAPITSAFGNLQGVSRDVSFLSAQLTTTPSVSAVTTAGLTGANSTSTSSSTPSTSTTTVTLQCPDGSLPTLGSSNTQGCTVPTGTPVPGTPPVSGSSSTLSTNSTTNPPSTAQTTNGSTTTSQNQTTVTNPSIAGAVPTAPASTALSAPANIGVASADILTEQVELNAQITSLRLLLEGALSDQYLVRSSRAVGSRQQATLGFTVTLDPPRQFKHAVAEVRVVVSPPEGKQGVSIMNLLPSEKTYNVAKVTSHQNAFGAGVSIAPIAVGANTGKAKDRLYLAKDTDTLALQFPVPQPYDHEINTPFPLWAHDWIKSRVEFEPLKPCGKRDRPPDISPDSVIFAWQFRPVLGADYVRGGQRQVFAQLALPVSVADPYVPTVYIQTRWREYDPKRQVVGAVYSDSCSATQDVGGVSLINSSRVDDLQLADLGGGQVKLTATGQFYTSAVSVLAGSSILAPITFEGSKIEVVGNAHDLIEAGDLTIVGENGQNSPFAITGKKDGQDTCGIDQADVTAIPYPDGNSRAQLHLVMGRGYVSDSDEDGPPNPLVLIGSQVYGLKETPFSTSTCSSSQSPVDCTYDFVAPTTNLRNAQTFLVRDLDWHGMQKTGKIDFYPSFASLTVSVSPPKPPDAKESTTKESNVTPTPKSGKTIYSVSGFDFDKIHCKPKGESSPMPPEKESPAAPTDKARRDARSTPCLKVFLGGDDKDVTEAFHHETNNLATLSLDTPGNNEGTPKAVRFQLTTTLDDKDSVSKVEWDLALPKADEAAKPTPSPAYLRVGDSGIVTFSGVDPSTVTTVTFEDQPPLQKQAGAASKSLDVFITTAVTKLPGHKELVATVQGAAKPLMLPIDVLRQ